MAIELPLNTMTIHEKLQIMEALWADLSQSGGALQSPQWHADVLAARKSQLEQGEFGVQDWNEAKRGLRESLE